MAFRSPLGAVGLRGIARTKCRIEVELYHLRVVTAHLLPHRKWLRELHPRTNTTATLFRGFSTDDGREGGPQNTPTNDGNGKVGTNNYSHLLTRATARQLKGDVGEAMSLTSEALSELRSLLAGSNDDSHTASHRQLSEEIADALMFLGKLYQLQGSYGGAVESFSEARDLYQRLMLPSDSSISESTVTITAATEPSTTMRRKELTALSHLASALSRLAPRTTATTDDDHHAMAEGNFRTALSGLEEIVGWGDGMTNHTAHEWSLFCKRREDYAEALAILARMKDGLSDFFGAGDHRVLQLNGEMADLWLKKQQQDEQQQDMGPDVDESHRGSEDTGTNATEATDALPTTAAEDNAMALLEEALDRLPPNSPEARRIFMQLEEWKEDRERGGEAAATEVTRGLGGVVVTRTRGQPPG